MSIMRSSRVEADHSCASKLGVTGSKFCHQCRHVKPAAAFFPSAYEPDGLTRRCRCCVLLSSNVDRDRREQRRAASRASRRAKPKRALPRRA